MGRPNSQDGFSTEEREAYEFNREEREAYENDILDNGFTAEQEDSILDYHEDNGGDFPKFVVDPDSEEYNFILSEMD